MKNKIKKIFTKIRPYLTIRMLMVFGGIWLLTTGWSYVFLIVGSAANLGWMWKIGVGAQVFFWNPLINEKLITIPFSIWLYKKIFKEDPNSTKNNIMGCDIHETKTQEEID